jgi:hypothetical protein
MIFGLIKEDQLPLVSAQRPIFKTHLSASKLFFKAIKDSTAHPVEAIAGDKDGILSQA